MKKRFKKILFDICQVFQFNLFVLCMMAFLSVQSAKAQYTMISDSNFEGFLVANGHDNIIDGQVLTSNISGITSLTIMTSGISSLEGIQDFTSLTYLNVAHNQLTILNINNLTNLEYLDCSYNQIQNLSINGLPNLSYVNCSSNNLTSFQLTNLNSINELYCSTNLLTTLDLSGLTSLTVLNCDSNSLTDLNVDGLNNLEILLCSVNNLTSLEISSLTSLYVLSCCYNNLTNLNVSGLNNLHQLYLFYNNLSFLDIRNTPSLNTLACYSNPSLTCILVNDVFVAQTTISTQKDSFTNFSTDCALLSVPNQDYDDLQVLAYPNPFEENFKLLVNSSSTEKVDITIYDAMGKLVEKRVINVNALNVIEIGSNYASGLYNIKLSQGEVTKTHRLLKK